MKYSELFQKIYELTYKTHLNYFDNYKNETFLPEIEDELLDLELDEKFQSVLENAFDMSVQYAIRIASSSLTQILGKAIKADADVDLTDPEIISDLTAYFTE